MTKYKGYIEILKGYLNHRSTNNIGVLTIGQGLAQLVSLIGAFYIPRLLGPDDYGIFQTVIAFVGMFSVFTFTGLNKVVLRECLKNKEDINNILELSIGLRHLFSLLAIILCGLISLFIDYEKGAQLYILIFSLSLWLKALDFTFNVIYQAIERMKYMAFLSLLKPLITVPLSIFVLLLGYNVFALIIVNIAVQGVIVIINYRISLKFIRFNIFPKIKWVKSYLKSGMNFSVLYFFNSLSSRIDILMLSLLTSSYNVGIYAFASIIIQKGLIARKAISTSLFPYYLKVNKGSGLTNKSLMKHTGFVILLSLVIIIPVLFFAEWVIVGIAGKDYLQSAEILKVLVFYLSLNFIIVPWSLQLQSLYKEVLLIKLSVVRAICNITFNLLFFYFWGIIGIAFSTLLTFVIYDALIIVLTRKLTSKIQQNEVN